MTGISIYISGLIISLVFSFIIFIYSAKHIRVNGAKYIALLSIIVFIWSLGYMFEIISVSLEDKIFWDNIQMLGGALGASCALFAIDFTEIKSRKINKLKYLLLLEPIIIWALANIFNHNGFRLEAKLIFSGDISALTYGFGYLSAIDFIYGYSMYFLFVFLILRYMRKSSKLYTSQTLVIVTGMTVVIVGFTLMLMGYGPVYFRDPTPITFTVLNLSLTYSTFGKKLFDVVPIARHTLFETLDEGILIIGKNMNVIDGNKYFKFIFDIDDIFSIDIDKFLEKYHFSIGDSGSKIELFEDKIINVRTVELIGNTGFMGYMLIFTDVSDEMKLRKTVETSEENYRNIAENSNDGIFIIQSGDIKYINGKVQEILKYNKDFILSSRFVDFVKDDQMGKVMLKYNEKIERKKVETRYNTVLVDANGQDVDVEINSTMTTFYGKEAVLGYIRDITEMKKQNSIIEKLAKIDSLTEIYNRGYFFSMVKDLLREEKCNYWLAMIDIDFFKSINDRYGHIVGDEILKKFASFIDDQLEYDIVFGRFGGEEFSIFSRTDTGYNPYDYLNRLRTSVMDHIFDTSKGEVKITISVGYSLSMDNCEAIEEVIKRADKALYQAKRNGRNRTEGL